MLAHAWPIALVVLSNIVYQITAKSVPSKLDPFLSVTITYLVGAAVSTTLYFIFNRGVSLAESLSKINWAPFAMGFSIVGLEVGFIYAYKAGWEVSTASVVQSSFLAVALLFAGYILYAEKLTAPKFVGMIICLVGLYFINK